MNEQLSIKDITGLPEELDSLRKAMALADDSPKSMQIEYTDTIKSKVGEHAPYYRFLEGKGRFMQNKGTYAGFYVETDSNEASFIGEDDDLPTYASTKYEEIPDKMKVAAVGIEVSMLTQMGNNHHDYLAREIEKGYIKLTNIFDKALLQGAGTTDKKDFKGINTAITSHKTTLNGTEQITLDVMDDMLTTLVDTENSAPDLILTNYEVAKQLREIVKPYRRFNDKIDIGIGHRVVTFESINGLELPIMIDPNLSGNTLTFIDSSTIEVKRLLAPTLFTDLPTNKLGYKQAIASFLTSQCIAEFQNGIITGIGNYTPSG